MQGFQFLPAEPEEVLWRRGLGREGAEQVPPAGLDLQPDPTGTLEHEVPHCRVGSTLRQRGPHKAPGLSGIVWGCPGWWDQEVVTSQGKHLLSGWGKPQSKGHLGAASSQPQLWQRGDGPIQQRPSG